MKKGTRGRVPFGLISAPAAAVVPKSCRRGAGCVRSRGYLRFFFAFFATFFFAVFFMLRILLR